MIPKVYNTSLINYSFLLLLLEVPIERPHIEFWNVELYDDFAVSFRIVVVNVFYSADSEGLVK